MFHRLLTLLLLPSLASALPRHPEAPPVNGWLVVSQQSGDGWRPAGRLAFGKHVTERRLLLPVESGPVVLRVQHRGPTPAHLDTVSLDGVLPTVVVGGKRRALRKLAADNDLIDVRNRAITLTFAAAQRGLARLAVRARVEPRRIPEEPFRFPASNLFRPMTPRSDFYRYRLDSRRGRLDVDGELADEGLAAPLFRVHTRPGTGHPEGYTYGWVKNDAERLYVALDFLPDNTMDGSKDYAEVYVKTRSGVRAYRVTASQKRWGRAGFTYTRRAGYQHKAYEFSIPLEEVGAHRGTVELAFAAYGTAAPDTGPPDTGAPPADQGNKDGADESGCDCTVPDADAAQLAPDTGAPDTGAPTGGQGNKAGGDEGCDCAVVDAGAAELALLLLVLLGLHAWRRRAD